MPDLTPPTITTRAGKGSALTFTESDNNLTALKNYTKAVADAFQAQHNSDGSIKDRAISGTKLKLNAVPYATATGPANAMVIAFNPVLADYIEGQVFWVKANNAVTGAATLDAGPGAKSIKSPSGGDVGGQIAAGQIFQVVYNGAQFILLGASPVSYRGAAAADVSMTTANTWYDGASMVLPAGKYLVTAQITFGKSTAGNLCARISDGATHYASTQINATTFGGLTLSAVITLAAGATIKIQGASSVAASAILAAINVNGSGNNATQINAITVS